MDGLLVKSTGEKAGENDKGQVLDASSTTTVPVTEEPMVGTAKKATPAPGSKPLRGVAKNVYEIEQTISQSIRDRAGTVVWIREANFPWWPAFVVSPLWVEPSSTNKALRIWRKKAEQDPDMLLAIYFRWGDTFAAVHASEDNVQSWNGTDHAMFTEGKALNKKGNVVQRARSANMMQELSLAIQEAEKEVVDAKAGVKESRKLLYPSSEFAKMYENHQLLLNEKLQKKTKRTMSTTTKKKKNVKIAKSSSKKKRKSFHRSKSSMEDEDEITQMLVDEEENDVEDEAEEAPVDDAKDGDWTETTEEKKSSRKVGKKAKHAKGKAAKADVKKSKKSSEGKVKKKKEPISDAMISKLLQMTRKVMEKIDDEELRVLSIKSTRKRIFHKLKISKQDVTKDMKNVVKTELERLVICRLAPPKTDSQRKRKRPVNDNSAPPVAPKPSRSMNSNGSKTTAPSSTNASLKKKKKRNKSLADLTAILRQYSGTKSFNLDVSLKCIQEMRKASMGLEIAPLTVALTSSQAGKVLSTLRKHSCVPLATAARELRTELRSKIAGQAISSGLPVSSVAAMASPQVNASTVSHEATQNQRKSSNPAMPIAKSRSSNPPMPVSMSVDSTGAVTRAVTEEIVSTVVTTTTTTPSS